MTSFYLLLMSEVAEAIVVERTTYLARLRVLQTMDQATYPASLF
jgi:hypothetical protein